MDELVSRGRGKAPQGGWVFTRVWLIRRRWIELLLGARLVARARRWQVPHSQPGEGGVRLSVGILAEIPRVGFSFEKSAGEGRKHTGYQHRRKAEPRKGLCSRFFLGDIGAHRAGPGEARAVVVWGGLTWKEEGVRVP